jgi:D-alanyl-D-alanine carboxypeptidase
MIFRSFLLLTLGLVTAALPLAAAKKEAAPDYKGAIVIDAATGNALFEKNPDAINPPASVTKLMTFLVVHDRIQSGNITLQTPVEVTAADAKIGGTQVWLKEGEVFTVEELLYALMVQSANDAANALSRVAGGTREAFVELMNARAQQLGMSNTKFRSPHGLPPPSRALSESDLTTPRDLSLLARELITKTDVLKYSSVKERPFRPNSANPVIMRNHNHLLGKVNGLDGLKTGFTNGAGFCLAATAQRNGRRIIAVVMGSPDRIVRDSRMADLIERGFAALPPGGPTAPSPAVAAGPGAVTPAAAPAPVISPISPVVAPTPAATAPAKQEPPPTVTFPSPSKKK